MDFKFKSKNEKLVYGLLCEIFPNTPIEYEYHVGQGLRVDFLVASTNRIGVEVDGAQHYQYSSLFHADSSDFTNQVNRDLKKETLCCRKGIVLVRVDCRRKVTTEELVNTISSALASRAVSSLEESAEDLLYKDREKRRQEYADSYKQFKKKIRAENKQRIKDNKNNGGANG